VPIVPVGDSWDSSYLRRSTSSGVIKTVVLMVAAPEAPTVNATAGALDIIRQLDDDKDVRFRQRHNTQTFQLPPTDLAQFSMAACRPVPPSLSNPFNSVADVVGLKQILRHGCFSPGLMGMRRRTPFARRRGAWDEPGNR